MNARRSFLIAFLLAAGGAVLLSLGGSGWASVGWAVAVMLGFLVWVRSQLMDYGESQGFADDFYFLGFLLTLVALATALLRLGDLGQADLLSTVLTQFGLALSTTIVGLAGRTMLLLDKEEAEGTEDRARLRVERAFDSLAHSLNRLSTEADVFSMQFGGKLKEALAPVETTVSRFSTTVAALEGELEGVAKSAGRMAEAVGRGAAQLSGATRGLSEELEGAGRRFSGDMTSLGAGIRGAGEGITRSAGQVVEAIESVNTRSAEALDQALSRLKSVTSSLESAGQGMSQLSSEVMVGLARDLQAVAQGLEQLRRESERVAGLVAIDAESLQKARGEWKEQSEALAGTQRALMNQVNGTGRAVADVRREIAEGVDHLVKALREIDRREEG